MNCFSWQLAMIALAETNHKSKVQAASSTRNKQSPELANPVCKLTKQDYKLK
ncbi:hypothetical protein [Dyadobacter sediminis]|uniref:hypothetical protein n=1 Tax=Dyadobacter sediminis TaxID=1493691 RepID=UPI0014874C85|nr:hypothetical protein [Dyadobacter sediminis]